VALGLGWLLLVSQVQAEGDDEQSYEAAAKALAGAVSDALEPYTTVAEALAGNPEVASTLAAGDVAAIDALATRLTPPLDGVLRLRLLRADTRDTDLAAKPPLTFATVSMLNKARESGADQPVEAHLPGKSSEHLVVLRRVLRADAEGGAGTLVGFVHLSVALDVARRVLAANPPADAYVEIRQGPSVSIAASGQRPAGDPPVSMANVPDSRLAVVFMAPGEAAAADAGGGGGGGLLDPTYLAALAALVLVGAAGGFARARRRGGRGGVVVAMPVSNDDVIYQGAIKNILDGAHPGLEQLLPGRRRGSLDGAFAARAEAEDATRFEIPGVVNEDPTIPRDEKDLPPVLDLTATPTSPAATMAGVDGVDPSIFRSYDIRGIVGTTLTEDAVYLIGRALGAEAERRGQKTVVVARDGRHSSEGLLQALAKGLLESGRDVLDIGLAPTPVLYFATHYLDAHSGVMITGSHNPPEYNGLKVVLDGETLSGEAIQAIRRRVEERDFVDGTGSLQSTDIIAEYIRRISEEIPVSLGDALKVVVDCGNAVPGMVAPAILRAIGHDVVELHCEVDGDFPNHHPDPSQPENLEQLIAAVAEEGADLGLAFDGDGDRLGVVDGDGNIIWPDRQLILFARDVLSRNPGAKVIFDVKCSRHLKDEIEAHGGVAIMTRTGHSLIKAEMQRSGALLGGELAGHIFFKERWYGFDDALYAAARLLEILVNGGRPPSEVFAELPGGIATPELRLDMPESRHAEFMAEVLAQASFDDGTTSTVDGLRVDFADGFGLVRPSNTTPCLTLRFEGDTPAALAAIMDRFRKLLGGIDPRLDLPF